MADSDAASPPKTNGSRIIGQGDEDPEQLLANPANWRIHPHYQQDMLADALDTVGWVHPIIVNTRTDHVIDGHLRIHLALARGERVPVTYVDLSLEEERFVLATLDPISALAITDKDQLGTLLDDIVDRSDDDGLHRVLNVIAKQNNVDPPAGVEPRESNEPQTEMCVCKCGHQHYKIRTE